MCTYLAISTVSPSIVQCSIVPMATIQGGAPSDLAEGAQGAGTKRSYSELMNAVKTVVHTISKVISQPLKGTSSELGGGKEAVSSAATAAAADILQEAFPQTDSGASMVAAIAVSAATSSGNPNPNPIEKEAAATAKAATEPVSKPPSASMLRASIVQTYMPDFTMPIKLVVKYDPFVPNRSNAQVDLGIIFADNYFGEVFGLTLEEQNFHMAYCSAGPGCSLNVAQKKMINFSQITGKMTDYVVICRLKDAILQMVPFQDFVNLHRINKKDGMSVLPCHIRYMPIRGSAAYEESKVDNIRKAYENISKGLHVDVTSYPNNLFKPTELIGLLTIRSATSIGVSKAICGNDDGYVSVNKISKSSGSRHTDAGMGAQSTKSSPQPTNSSTMPVNDGEYESEEFQM